MTDNSSALHPGNHSPHVATLFTSVLHFLPEHLRILRSAEDLERNFTEKFRCEPFNSLPIVEGNR